MVRPSNRRTADVLRKTIRELESDPTVDRRDPAFVNLKCTLLQRILELENDKAHAEAVMPVVDATEKQPQKRAAEEDGLEIA